MSQARAAWRSAGGASAAVGAPGAAAGSSAGSLSVSHPKDRQTADDATIEAALIALDGGPDGRRARRRDRARTRRAVAKLSANEYVRTCGHRSLGQVQIRQKDGTAYYANVGYCGMAWICPTCSARIGQRRAEEIAKMLTAHRDSGGMAFFGTLTMRHGRGEALDRMVTVLRKAFTDLTSSRGWRAWRARYSMAGFVRSFEVTPGGLTGSPHPHCHLLVCLDRPSVTLVEHAEAMAELSALWAQAVARLAPDLAPSAEAGVRLDQVDLDSADRLASYAAKGAGWSAAIEMSRTDLKAARAGVFASYWDVARAAAAGNRQALAMWREYEFATYKLVRIAWSQRQWSLRKRYSLGDTKSDEEIAQADDTDGELVVELDPFEARLIREAGELTKVLVLEVAEHGGAEGVRSMLQAIRGSELCVS